MKVIDIGELIKSERQKKGMTQADLAFDLCTVATLSRIENGLHMPKSDVLFGLLERLEISEYKLLGPMFDDSDFDTNVHFLKEKIERLCSNNKWSEMRSCMDELQSYNIDYYPTDRQFMIVYETIYNYETNYLDKISFDDLLEAVRLTISDYSVDTEIDYRLTLYEQYLLIFLAHCLIADGKAPLAGPIIDNLSRSFGNTVTVNRMWNRPVFYFYKLQIGFFLDKKDYEPALIAILNHDSYCIRQQIYSKLITYGFEEVLCLVKLGKVDEARECFLKHYFHLRGIRKLDEAESFRARIKSEFSIDFKIVERRTK